MAIIFSTTFDIPEWTTPDGLSDADLAPDGDGIEGFLSNSSSDGNYDQITSAANMAAGGGGRGFRHWIGDGSNNGGGGILITFPAREEIWMRYYVRYEQGFQWNELGNWGDSVFNKQIYTLFTGSNEQIYGGLQWGTVGFEVQADVVNEYGILSWRDAYCEGGTTSTGDWHLMEIHIKVNQTGGAGNGIFEFKFDGALQYSDTAVNITNENNILADAIRFGSNHSSPNNGQDMRQDFDDIAISDSGWIGGVQQESLILRPAMSM